MSKAAEAGGRPRGKTTVRVRYPETDRMKVAYHAHYLVWFEIGRTELMRELDCDYATLEERRGIYFPLREVGARYRSPARYDDLLEVETELVGVGGASARFDYRVVRPADGRLIATGYTAHAAVDGEGRPQRLPAGIRQRLAGGAAS